MQKTRQRGEDDTQYRRLDGASKHVSVAEIGGRQILNVGAEALRQLAAEAFDDVSHLLTTPGMPLTASRAFF